MSDITVNEAGVEHACGLIEAGRVVRDRDDWRAVNPDAATADAFIERHGYAAYGRWHLGIDPGADPETKAAYSFPYGDFEDVHTSGLLAAQERAAQWDHDGIASVARELLALADSD